MREDYSENGTAWENVPHDHARSRAYRWGEDGIAGISDDRTNSSAFRARAMERSTISILKERLFGLTGNQGNHGEDVKEYYYYLDNVPSHAYMKMLYKYPQNAFPYGQLVEENAKRGQATIRSSSSSARVRSRAMSTSTSSSSMRRTAPTTSSSTSPPANRSQRRACAAFIADVVVSQRVVVEKSVSERPHI